MTLKQLRRKLHQSVSVACVVALAAPAPGTAWAQVVADGRTSTNVATSGSVTDVTTSTVVRSQGVNTFSSFSTGAGSTVNLHVPNGARGTVNIVNGSRSQINGAVRSMRSGQVGGDLYIANPNGFVVGPSGSVQAGSVSLSTPTQQFVDGFVNGGSVSSSHVDQVVSGTAPQSGAGIDVQGAVRGNSAVRLRTGGDIAISGEVTAGDRSAIMRGAVRGAGPAPGVTLDAGGSVEITGSGRVVSVDGLSGGQVRVRGFDVVLEPGTRILAEGEGAGHGGTVDLFAKGAARLGSGATISVAALDRGDGGYLAFAGEALTQINGVLDAASQNGIGGIVDTLNPIDLTINGEIRSGADFAATAIGSITVTEDAIISTRDIGGSSDHLGAVSKGDSGNITLSAPDIEIQTGAQLLAFVEDGSTFQAGDITIEAKRIDSDGHTTEPLFFSESGIRINGAYLRGGDIRLLAEVEKDNLVGLSDTADLYLDELKLSDADIPVVSDLIALIEKAAEKGDQAIEDLNFENWPSYLAATARIEIDGSSLIASGDLDIQAKARTRVEIGPDTDGLAIVVAASNLKAETIVVDSALKAGKDLAVGSATEVVQDLNAQAAQGLGLSASDEDRLNIAAAGSFRFAQATTVVSGDGEVAFDPTDKDGNVAGFAEAKSEGKDSIEITAINTTDVRVRSEALLSDDAFGTAILAAVDDLSATTAVGTKLVNTKGKISVESLNDYAQVDYAARVTGGTLTDDDTPADEPDGTPQDNEEQLAPVLGVATSIANEATGVEASSGAPNPGDSGHDASDNPIGVAVAITNHRAEADTIFGGNDFTFGAPSEADAKLGKATILVEPESAGVDPETGAKLELDETGVEIAARNRLGAVSQLVLAAAGSVDAPDADAAGALTGKSQNELDADGGRVLLGAFSLADWDLEANALVAGKLDEPASAGAPLQIPTGFDAEPNIITPGSFTLVAENVAPNAAGRSLLGGLHARRKAEILGEADAGADPSLTGAWSNGDGPLFADGDGDPAALSVARTFGAGEELGLGFSFARLSGDQSATATLGAGANIKDNAEDYGTIAEGDTEERYRVMANQRGAWGASAGDPGDRFGATEGSGFGASVAWADINAQTLANVENGVVIDATENINTVAVSADDDRLIYSAARAHGSAEAANFSGALSVTQRNDTVQAFVGHQTDFTILGDLALSAVNSGDTLTVVSGASTGNTALGVGVSLAFNDRTTEARILGRDEALVYGPDTNLSGWAMLGGLEVSAESTGNVVIGGSVSAEAGAGSGGDAAQNDEDAVDIDPETLGDDADRVQDAIGGGAPNSGSGGGFTFAGDFGGLFADVTTRAGIADRDGVFSQHDADDIYVDVEGEVSVSALTDVDYGQSSAVTAAASGGIGISGSFGLTAIAHETTTILRDTDIEYGADLVGDDNSLKPLTISSRDRSTLDLLIDGKTGRADDGWGISVAANFARVESIARTELLDTSIRFGTGDGPFDSGGFGGGEEGGGEYEEGDFGDGEFFEEGCEECFVETTDDGRDIEITAHAVPEVTIRASSLREGPEPGTDPTTPADPNTGDDPKPGDVADTEQMEAVADLVRDAGEESRKSQDEGGGLKGLSITVAPLRLIADSRVLLEDSLVEVDPNADQNGQPKGQAGTLEVASNARTGLDIMAGSDTIAAAIGITDTNSRVIFRSTDLDAFNDGTMTIASNAIEDHVIRATAGAERFIKAAGILSLRSVDNRILIDAEQELVPSWRRDNTTFTTSRFISGDALTISARTEHDLEFEVVAADGTASALALAGIISLSDTVTEVASGATIFHDGDSPAVIKAENVYTQYSARAIASAGTLVPGAEDPADGGEDDGDPNDRPGDGDGGKIGKVAIALMDVSDETQEDVQEDQPAPPGGGEAPETRATFKDAFALAFNLERHDAVAVTRLGGERYQPDATEPLYVGSTILGGWNEDRGSAAVSAANRIESFTKETRAAIGTGSDTPRAGAVVAVPLGDWNLTTDAALGRNFFTSSADSIAVNATTALPQIAFANDPKDQFVDNGGTPDEAGDDTVLDRDAMFERGAGGYLDIDNRSLSADSLVGGDNWNIVTSTQTDGDKAAIAVDVAIHRFRTQTTARFAATENPGSIDTKSLGLTATTNGGFASRRDSNDPNASGGFGVGGSGHVLILRPTTEAIFEAPLADSRGNSQGAIGALSLSATNDLTAATAAASYGNADSFALNIAFAMTDYDGVARARLIDPSRYKMGETSVLARDTSTLLADAGSGASGSTSIGVSPALVFADRTADAEIITNPDPTSPYTGDWVLGATTVAALIGGDTIVSSVAGAGLAEDTAEDTDGDGETDGRKETELPVKLLGDRATTNADDFADKTADTKTDDPTSPDDNLDSPADGKEFGFAFAGDFSGIFGDAKATARIEHNAAVDTTASGDAMLSVVATNTTRNFAAAGSAVAGAGNIGIAASVALGRLDRTTRASVSAPDLRLGGAASFVQAFDTTTMNLFSAGRGGAAVKNTILGSASVDISTVTTEALVTDTQISQAPTGGGLTVLARNGGSSLLLAGAVRDPAEEDDSGDTPDTPEAPDTPAGPDDTGTDEGEGGGDGSGGFSVGIAFAGNVQTETVRALIDESTVSAGAVTVNAQRHGSMDSAAASSGSSDSFTLAAAAAVNVTNRDVTADFVGGSVEAGAVAVTAADSADSRARIGSDAAAGNVSFGASAAVVVEDRLVRARITDAGLTGDPALTVSATQSGSVDVMQKGGGESEEGIAGNIGVGVVVSDRTTAALVENTTVAASSARVTALSEGELINRQGLSVDAEMAGAIGVIVTDLTANTSARIVGGNVDTGNGDVEIDARQASRLVARSGKTGSGENALNVMVSSATLNGAVVAEARDTDLSGGTAAITAKDESILQSAAIARANSGGVGIVGGVAYARTGLDVHALITDTALDFADQTELSAIGEAGLTGTVVGMNFGGGSFAAAVQAGWLTSNREIIARASGDFGGAINGGLDVLAARRDKLIGISVTAQEANAAVGIGGNVLQTGGRTLAEVLVDDDLTINGALGVRARDESEAANIAIGAATGSGSFSLVGSLAYTQMGRRPAGARILDPNERSQAHEAQNETTRDDVGGSVADALQLNSSERAELTRRMDLAVEARVQVADNTDLTVMGNTLIRAEDGRKASSIAGQLSIGFDTGGLVGEAANAVTIDENGISITARDVANTVLSNLIDIYLFGLPSGDDDGGLSEAGGEASGDRPDGDGGSSGGGGGGASIGLSFGWARLGGLVSADLILGRVSSAELADATIAATSTARAMGLSAGASAGQSAFALGAGAGISRHDQLVRAQVAGAGSSPSNGSALRVGNLTVEALSDGQSRAIAGSVTATSGNVAVAAVLAVSDMDAQTEARVSDILVDVGGDVALSSVDEGGALSLGVSVGASTGVGIGLSVGVNSAKSITRASILDAEVDSNRDVVVATRRSQRMNAFVLQASVGSSAGVGATLGISEQKGESQALIENSTVHAGDDVIVDTFGDSELTAAAVGAAGGGSAGISGSISITIKRDLAAAKIVDSTVVADDSVLVRAVNGGILSGVGGGDDSASRELGASQTTGSIAIGGSVGIGVSVSVISMASEVVSEVRDSSVTANARDSGIDTITRTATGDVRTDYAEREDTTISGVSVIADNQTSLQAIAISVAAAGSAAIGLQVPVLLVRDDVKARIVDSTVVSGQNVIAEAYNQSDIFTFSLTAAIGIGGAGVGALVEVGSLKKSTATEVIASTIDAHRDIILTAAAPEKLSKNSIAVAGGLYAGVAGIVESLVTTNVTRTVVYDSTLISGRDTRLLAASPRNIANNAATAAGGIAGVAGGVIVINARDETRAEIVDGDSGDASTLLVTRDLDVTADSQLRANTIVAGAAGGLVGVSGSIVVSKFEQKVFARIGNNTDFGVREGAPALRNVNVNAVQGFDQSLTVGAVAGGFVGIGASIGVTNVRNTVEASIGRNVEIAATDTINVHADGVRDLNATALTVGGGAVAFQGAALVASFAASADDEESRGTVEDVNDGMQGDPFAADADGDPDTAGDDSPVNADSQLGNLLTEAIADRDTVDLGALYATGQTDALRASIGDNASLQAGGAVNIAAREDGLIKMRAGAAAIGGFAGVSGGVVTLKRGSTIVTDIGDRVDISGGNVFIGASAVDQTGQRDVDDDGNLLGNQVAVAGSGGLVSVNAAVAVTTLSRDIDVQFGSNVNINAGSGNVDISAREDGETWASTISAAGGAIANGGAIARTKRETNIAIDLDNADIIGVNVDVTAERDGLLRSQGIAAAGGVVSGVGVVADTRDEATVTVDLGTAHIQTLDVATIRASNAANVTSRAIGVAISGGGAVGVSSAVAKREGLAEITGYGVRFRVGSLSVTTNDAVSMNDADVSLVDARATSAAGGGLLGGQGARSNAVNESRSIIDLAIASLVAEGDVAIDARTNGAIDSRTDGFSLGLAAAGANLTQARMSSTASTRVDLAGNASALGSVLIGATAADSTFGKSVSGQGGGIALQASKVELDMLPTTTVAVTGNRFQTLGRIDVAAVRTSTFEVEADSLQASFAGGSGTALESTVDATISVDIDAELLAPTIAVSSSQQITKLADGFNIRTTTGGVASGSSVGSDTVVNVDSGITIGGHLEQLRGAFLVGEGIDVALNNSFDLVDRLELDTGGGVAVPRGDGEMRIDVRSADVTFDDAVITAFDDITVTVTNDVDASLESNVAAYGLAGAPKGVTTLSFDADQAITLDGSTQLTSRAGSVRLLNGRTVTRQQEILLNSETRIFNGTTIPVPAGVDAIAEADIQSGLVIGRDSRILAARDVRLVSDGGFVDPYGYFSVSNIYSEGTEAIVNFFGNIVGADEVSLDRIGGTSRDLSGSRTIIDGTVIAGAFAEATIDIGLDGTITTGGNTEGVTVRYDTNELRNAALVGFIAEREAELDAIDIYAEGADALRARRQAEIDSLNARLARLGGPDAAGDIVTVSPIVASVGNVEIFTDAMGGDGIVEANGDALIRITNASPALLEVEGAEVPFRAGGEIRVNTVAVRNNADVLNRVDEDDFVPAQLDIRPSDNDPPSISISGTYVGAGDDDRSDIVISGNVENLNGDITVSTLDGNVLVLDADISGRNVVIDAGGDFFLSAPPGVTTVGGRDPAGLYRDFFAEYENMSQEAYIGYLNARGDAAIADPFGVFALAFNSADLPAFERERGNGQIRAIGGVYIYADTLNIDGTIQSGETNWTLGIDPFLSTRLANLTPAEIAGRDRILISRPVRDEGDLLIGDEILGALGQAPLVNGNVSLWYNVASGELEVDPMITKGGYVELVGRIISTGGNWRNGPTENQARITAANGYGRVIVNNMSDLPIVFSEINTATVPVEGFISITDLGNKVLDRPPGQADVFQTTTYRMDGDQIRRTTLAPLNLGGSTTVIPISTTLDPDTAEFNIAGNYALEYTRSRELERTEVFNRTFVQRRFASNGAIDETSEGEQLVLTAPEDTTLLETATLVTTTAGDLNTPYDYSRDVTTFDIDDTGWVDTDEDWTVTLRDPSGLFWLRRTRPQERTIVRNFEQLDNHEIAANVPISIGFEGFESSALTVDSVGDVRFTGNVFNIAGDTEIISTSGSISAENGNSVLFLDNARFEAAGDISGADFAVTRRVGSIGGGGTVSVPRATARTGIAEMVLEQNDGARLFAQSNGGDVLLRELSGNVVVSQISGNRVRLVAPGSIFRENRLNRPNPTFGADTLELVAEGGAIGTQQGPLPVFVATRLDAEALGNISISSPVFDLPVGSVVSTDGEVQLTSTRSITDANDNAIPDRRAIDGLLDELWDEIGLRDLGAASQGRIEETTRGLAAAERADYEFYWSVRREILVERNQTGEIVDKKVVDRGYDSDFEFKFTSEQVAVMLAGSDGIEPLTGDQIDAQAAERTQAYHRIHAKYGDQAYDPNIKLELDETLVADTRRSMFFSDAQLRNRLRADLVLGITDTELTIEEANITADTANLSANLSIGSRIDPVVLRDGDELTEELLAALWTAEPGDIVRRGGETVITIFDDVDVDLNGPLTASAFRDALLGSEGDLEVTSVEANEIVRVKAGGAITRTPGGGQVDAIAGNQIVLEAANGGIGTLPEEIRVRTRGRDASVSARASEGIFIVADGDLPIGTIFTPASVRLIADGGSITGLGGQTTPHINAASVLFAAQGSVGAGGNAPVVAAADGAEIVVLSDTTGGLAFDVAAGNTARYLLSGAEVPQTISIGGDGNLVLGDSIFAWGAINVAVNDLDLSQHLLSNGGGGIDIALTGTLDATGPDAWIDAAGGLLLSADRIRLGTTGALRIDAERLEARIANGGFAVTADGDLSLDELIVDSANPVQLVAGGALTLNGKVQSTADGTTFLLTGRQGVFGAANMAAETLFLTANAGGIDVELDVSNLETLNVANYAGTILLDVLRGDVRSDFITAAQGEVFITHFNAGDEVEVDRIGAVQDPLIVATSFSFDDWGSDPIELSREFGFQPARPDLYTAIAVPGPGQPGSGGGNTGGGGIGGGGTGGGDTGGGGNAGGGNAGGGDTGGGNPGGNGGGSSGGNAGGGSNGGNAGGAGAGSGNSAGSGSSGGVISGGNNGKVSGTVGGLIGGRNSGRFPVFQGTRASGGANSGGGTVLFRTRSNAGGPSVVLQNATDIGNGKTDEDDDEREEEEE